MDNKTSQDEKPWFSDLSWKTSLAYLVLAVIAGGGSGAGLVATKAVAAEGLNKDQADVRYLSKTEAQQWRESRSKEIEELKRDIKGDIEKNLKKDTFEAYHSNDVARMERIEKLLEQMAQKR